MSAAVRVEDDPNSGSGRNEGLTMSGHSRSISLASMWPLRFSYRLGQIRVSAADATETRYLRT